jgi:FAD/FMN-containing dehydrogenase
VEAHLIPVDQFERILGSRGCLTDPGSVDGYLTDWRGIFRGRASCVLRPSTVVEVSKVVALCHEQGIGIVAQGGNTSLTGAATPDESGHQVVLSTSRLKRIRKIDPVDMTIVAESGATIAELQSAAADAGRYSPFRSRPKEARR